MAVSNKRKRYWITATVLLIILVSLVIAPILLKNYVISNSKELIGRQISMDNLRYNYFTSTAKVFNFKMFEANDKDTFVSFDTLIVDLEPLRLLFGERNLEQFYVKGLNVRIQMQDSTFNFDDLVDFHTNTGDTLTVAGEDFKYNLSNLELKEANFYFDDQNVGKETQIENFSFFIPQIIWDQGHKSKADLEFSFKNGGYFKSDLNIHPVNGDFDADIEVNTLNLDSFYEYVAQYAEINDFKGNLNANIHIVGNTENAKESIVSGQVQINNFNVVDQNNREFIKTDSANIALTEIDYANSSFKIGTIGLKKPYIYFEMDSTTNNFFTAFKLNEIDSTTSVKAEEKTNPTEPIYYEIEKLKVTDGLMDYSDNLTGERFDYHLNGITVNTDKIVSTSEWINIYADMLLNNRGTLKSKLGINPNDYKNLDLDMVIENFLLSDINIYANHYTGHNILVGDFYYYSKSKITNGAIQSDNQLLVKNVSVENKKGGLYTLPLKFALFLLKDKNGDVNLTVPVRGNLDNPELNIGKLVWTTLKNKITGAASDPIGVLANLVDVKPENYKELIFEYTDTVPNEDNYMKLDKLLEMESAKEGLKIQLEHYLDKNLQKEALAIQKLGKKFNREKQRDYQKDEEDFRGYLRKETNNDTISIRNAALLLVPQEELNVLANAYQEALRRNVTGYLKMKKPLTTIEIVPANPNEPNHLGSKNRLQINFDMLTVLADEKPQTVNQNNSPTDSTNRN